MRTKSYFAYKETDEWYLWENEKGERLFFWGNPKFIVSSLVDLFWIEKGKQVFEDFMNWVKHIKDLWIFLNWKPTATFVLYQNSRNDHKEQWSIHTKEV